MAIRPRDAELVSIAYDIRQWIVKEYGKYCPYKRADVNPIENQQTETGLILERKGGWPHLIYTPIGALQIWDVVDDSYYQQGSLVTSQLKLLLNFFELCDFKPLDCYSITQWKGKRIEDPKYRSESLSESQVRTIWAQVTDSKRSILSKFFGR